MTDQILHVLLSFVGLLPLVLVYRLEPTLWAFVLAGTCSGFWFSWWREDAQHRKFEGWSWPFQGEGGRWLDMAFSALGGFALGVLAAVLN